MEHNEEGDAVEGPVDLVSRDEVVQALNEREKGKAQNPSDVSLELIAVGSGVRIQMMAEICQRALDGFAARESKN